MKKVISIILAVLMLMALFSCNGKTTETSASTSEETSQASQSTEEADMAETTDAEAAETVEDVSASENSIGFFTSGVDPQSRDTYEIVFAYTMTMLLYEEMTKAMEQLSEQLNFTISTTTGELDADKYITNIETMAARGVDGFVAEIDPAVSDRLNEVYQELGIPYITIFSAVRDENGSAIAPCVLLDGYATGATTVQWLYDNYQTYWGDIDTSKIALLNFTFSTLEDLQLRADGALDKFNELLPDNTMIFTADAASNSSADAEAAYNATAPIFSSNPDVEYWWVACSIETFAQGTARAVESLDMEDRVLIVDVGSDELCAEWDNGYDGSWVSCLAISNYIYATPALCGLIAMIDGKADFDSLWSSKRAAGDQATLYYVDYDMVTKDTYQEYFQNINDELGL